MRGYKEDSMRSLLNKIGFSYISDSVDTSVLCRDQFSDFGLVKNNNFILRNRYIFPVKDMLGNVLALIGWYPDEKKYITTPSRLYSTNGLFFGMEQLRTGQIKNAVITEGIFDSLAVRSCGYNSFAQMGIITSEVKTTLYGVLGRRLLAIPDNDISGRRVVQQDRWHMPKGSSYMNWTTNKNIKDIDDLYKYYGETGLKDLLDDAMSDYERVITYKIV